jgi:predicted nucleotide-binding protein
MQLQEAHAKVINNDHSNTNNITTIGRDQNIIIVNNFGEENIEYLLKDENFVKKCIESPINSIHQYLDNVHFNNEHPENKNIKMTNLLGPYMDYIKEGKWNKIEKNILIPKIINKSIDTVDNIMYADLEDDSDSDSDNDKPLKAWDEYSNIKYGENDKLKNKITNKAKRHIYNTTHKLK